MLVDSTSLNESMVDSPSLNESMMVDSPSLNESMMVERGVQSPIVHNSLCQSTVMETGENVDL